MKRAFNFDNFYVYDGNRVAYLAAQKIVQFPGEIFNPFYIYSGTGLGKTHLLWAIHTELNKKITTLFFNGKEFEKYLDETKEFNTPIIVDDIYTISDKYQAAFRDIIDIFLANNKQLCFSGNIAPRDLKNFNPKLVSRLEGGLVCDIQPPKEIALVEMIKKKSEEMGIILPDETALELAQLSTGSFRAIEGMVNRLVAYASLGNLSIDIDSVRIILKEFYPRGIYSPVSSLLEELKKNASEILQEVSEKMDMREEYKERIYIWEMKGFDTASLKPLLEGELEKLATAYNEFIKKVERLIELQKEFGASDTANFPNEAMMIETMLFSPEKIVEIEKIIDKIKAKPQPVEPTKTLETFFIGESNKPAYELYQNTILPSLGSKFNPFVIIGKKGTGKTHFLEAIYNDVKKQGKLPILYDLAVKNEISGKDLKDIDVLLVDNFSFILSAPDDLRKNFFKNILDFIKQDKEVILGTEAPPYDLSLFASEKVIFELGIEVLLNPPSRDIVERYIESRLTQPAAEQVIKNGLPNFVSFYEVIDYLNTYIAEQPVVRPEPSEEIISLGLPGEEIKEEVLKEETPVLKAEIEKEKEIKLLIEEVPLRKLKEDRLIIPEILGDLIEENY